MLTPVARIAIYAHYEKNRYKKSEATDAPDASDKGHTHLNSLESSGPPTKRTKVDNRDIADKVPFEPRPCDNCKLSWSSPPQISSDASLRYLQPALRRPRREKIWKRSIALLTSMRRVIQQRYESPSKFAHSYDAARFPYAG